MEYVKEVHLQGLTCSQQACILNASKEKLASEPTFRSTRQLAAEGKMTDDIYRYFGMQPYWTDKGFSRGGYPGGYGYDVNNPYGW